MAKKHNDEHSKSESKVSHPESSRLAILDEVRRDLYAPDIKTLSDSTKKRMPDSSESKKEPTLKNIEFQKANPDATPAELHRAWLKQKNHEGWSFALVLDSVKKEDPCFVPFDDLSPELQSRDAVCNRLLGI